MHPRRLLNLVTFYAIVLILLLAVIVFHTYTYSSTYNDTPVVIQLSLLSENSDTNFVKAGRIMDGTAERTAFQQTVVTDDPVDSSRGYDDYGWHPDRLGTGIGPEFYRLPDPWQRGWNVKPDTLEQIGKRTPKKILLYDSFKWWQFDGILNCPEISHLSCEMYDMGFRASGSESKILEGMDAVIFVRDFAHKEHVEPLLALNPNVTGIFFTMESPYGASFRVSLNPRRSRLASYWRGSDIYAPYSRWLCNDAAISTPPKGRNFADGRTKMAAIVVSNCHSQNDRLGLVVELQKYIKVDVYGRCGSPCTDDCFDMLQKHYKFYLAFENSNCRDYITEKFYWNALRHELVPVALGAHPDDYKATAPKDSFILVEDFKTVKALADYLILLDRNDSLYNEYFKWKGTGNFSPLSFLCEACAFVHKIDQANFSSISDETRRTYLNSEDIYMDSSFDWSPDNSMLCLEPKRWYWNP